MTRKSTITKMGILKEIEKYIDVLLKNNIKPKKVILFGSYAKKRPRRYSDIDLAIISDQFKKDAIDSMMTLSKLTLGVSDRIEAVALTPKDMESKYHPLIGEIKKYGKVVYSS